MQSDALDTDQEDSDCKVSGDPLTTPNGTGAPRHSALTRQSRSLELPAGALDRDGHALPRQKMLMRSQAMREESSPPPDLELAPRYSLHLGGSQPLRKFHSQGSADGRAGSPHLSRDFSGEIYTDSKGVDVERFLAEALNANSKDQAHLLKYEQDMISFIEDNGRSEFRFPPQSSYQRMLVHRAAVYFGLDHNVDPTGTCVIITKTERTRIPELRFRDLLRDDGDEPKRLLKRDGILGHYSRSFDSQSSLDSRRSKSFEEREVEYKKTRTRIFNNQEEMEYEAWQGGGRPALQQPRRQMPSKAHSVDQPPRYARLSKADSLEGSGPPLRLSGTASMRPPGVSKSHSFGGYTGAPLSRGDSTASQQSACSARLAKQDSSVSSVSRLSPSSGYKTASVSQITLDSTPSPTNNQGYALEEAAAAAGRADSQPVLWAVSNLEDVPPGSVIIDPHSGQPYLNADRTVYRYNPANPPQLAVPAVPQHTPAPLLATPTAAAAPAGYQPLPPPLPAVSSSGVRYLAAGTDAAPLQYVQYVAAAGTPPAAPLQYATAGVYPMVAGQQHQQGLQQAAAGEKSVSEVSQQMLGLSLAEPAGGDAPLGSQQQYVLTYRSPPAQQPPQPAPTPQQQTLPPPQQQPQQQMYCLPGPAVPLRYMTYQHVIGSEQAPQSYMGVYPAGSLPAADPAYFMTSPPGGTTAVYPVSPFYGGPYSSAAGRPAAELSPSGQQVLGFPATQYPGLVATAPAVSGRLLNGQRLRQTESVDDSLLMHQHSQQMAGPAPAYQRPLPLNPVRLIAPLRPPAPQAAALPGSAARPGRARRSRARSKASSEGALTPSADPGCVLEVEGAWSGLRRCELERHLQEPVAAAGGRLQYGGAGTPPADAPLPAPPPVTAVFETPAGAEAALLATRGARLRLRRPDN